jgi:hypothetical protein
LLIFSAQRGTSPSPLCRRLRSSLQDVTAITQICLTRHDTMLRTMRR